MCERIIINAQVERAVAVLGVADRTSDQLRNIRLGQRLELEDLASADQCVIHREKRVFRGRPDERDHAALDVAE